MNIFVLSYDPRKAAKMHCDKHVVKMCLETAQILSTVNRLLGDNSETLYRVTHQSHPCVKWVLEDSKNYFWLMQLFHCLLLEYQHRYDKEHACTKIYKFLCSVDNTKLIESKLPSNKTHSVIEFKSNDFVSVTDNQEPLVSNSYKQYYINKSKVMNMTWTKRNKPDFMEVVA